jgi:hypothetical protein
MKRREKKQRNIQTIYDNRAQYTGAFQALEQRNEERQKI